MKVTLQDGFVTLTPENDEDRTTLAETFGEPEGKPDSHGYREFHEKASGMHITLNDDGVSVNIMAADAWWNYDDRYDD